MNILKLGGGDASGKVSSISKAMGKDSATSFNGSGSDQTRILVHMPQNQGRVVSLGACTKVCVISFTLGVFVGFTLKRRLRQWITKLLKRIKDD